MKRNGFQEAYCANQIEVERELEFKDLSADLVYAVRVAPDDAPLPFAQSYTEAVEVMENCSGETVLFIEASNMDIIRSICEDVGIEIQE